MKLRKESIGKTTKERNKETENKMMKLRDLIKKEQELQLMNNEINEK